MGDDDKDTTTNTNTNKSLYSVILPTYEERENLPLIVYLLYETFTTHQIPYEIIIVDDSSSDGTLDVAQSLQLHFGGESIIKIISRPSKLGLGSAYAAGLKISRGDYIILMDADLSHHPKYIPQMINCMNNSNNIDNKVDIVSGTRYRKGGGVSGWDLKRKLTSRGANFLASFLLNPGPKATDLTGSFRLYTKSCLQHILPLVISHGYAFQMEVLIRAHDHGYNIDEVPIVFVDRIYGYSKLGTKEIILYIRGLIQLFFTT